MERSQKQEYEAQDITEDLSHILSLLGLYLLALILDVSPWGRLIS